MAEHAPLPACADMKVRQRAKVLMVALVKPLAWH